jgi:hypothetical protein
MYLKGKTSKRQRSTIEAHPHDRGNSFSVLRRRVWLSVAYKFHANVAKENINIRDYRLQIKESTYIGT